MQSNVKRTRMRATRSEGFVVSVRGRDGHTAFWLAQKRKPVERSVSTVEEDVLDNDGQERKKGQERDGFEKIIN
jgi:hypothetical protein